MLDFFRDPGVLSFISLAGGWFYAAFILSLIILAVQSSYYSTDPRFRMIYFCVGFSMAVVFFIVNAYFTQRAGVSGYRPVLVGASLFDDAKAFLEAPVPPGAPRPTLELKQIEHALNGEIFRHSWKALMLMALLFFIGVYSAITPPPKWKQKVGLDVLKAVVPNIINYSIFSIFIQNLFISGNILIINVMMFDLIQISNIPNYNSEYNFFNPPSFFSTKNLESRFLIVMTLGPFFLAFAIGTVLRLRYRMMNGGLIGYRPDELKKLVVAYRAEERKEVPRLHS